MKLALEVIFKSLFLSSSESDAGPIRIKGMLNYFSMFVFRIDGTSEFLGTWNSAL
jgi:hypothetical protein